MKKSDIARSFSLATQTYDQHAFIQKEIGERLLERVALIKKPPQRILDIGAGTGFLTRQLQSMFPKSQIIGLDLAQGMTQYAKNKQSWQLWRNKPAYVCGDTELLPFAHQSFDLIFSNCTLQWCPHLKHAFAEFKRVLKPNGMLFFTTLGPQTLHELKASWAKVDELTHVNTFIDMHDLGDLLLTTRFTDPVIDMEMVTVNYPSVKSLLKDLKATGAHNLNAQRLKGCTSKKCFNEMFLAYEAFKQADHLYPATFEVIYGHALSMPQSVYSADKDGIVKIPADNIPITLSMHV